MPTLETGEERRAAVHLFKTRGNRTAQEVADELGVSPQILYNWAKRLSEGDDLERRAPGPPPKDKGHLEHAARQKASIVVAKAVQDKAATMVAQRVPQQISLDLPDDRPPSYAEWILLKNENAMLKRMLEAALHGQPQN